MTTSRFEKTALGLSGLTALGVGMFILIEPHAFFASYDIVLESDASLLSELRAPAAGLAAFGIIMLLGIWRAAITPISKVAALTVFLAFPAGRVIGLVVDGLPSDPILGALIFELAVAGLCIAAFSRRALPAHA